jgi:hypothetical protein
MQIVDLEMARRRALNGAASGLLRLKWLAAATRFELALRRHNRALKYNPDQPRVPAGNSDGGQWTSGGGSTGRMRLAGDIPTGDSPPEIPDKIPSNPRTKWPLSKRQQNGLHAPVDRLGSLSNQALGRTFTAIRLKHIGIRPNP